MSISNFSLVQNREKPCFGQIKFIKKIGETQTGMVVWWFDVMNKIVICTWNFSFSKSSLFETWKKKLWWTCFFSESLTTIYFKLRGIQQLRGQNFAIFLSSPPPCVVWTVFIPYTVDKNRLFTPSPPSPHLVQVVSYWMAP